MGLCSSQQSWPSWPSWPPPCACPWSCPCPQSWPPMPCECAPSTRSSTRFVSRPKTPSSTMSLPSTGGASPEENARMRRTDSETSTPVTSQRPSVDASAPRTSTRARPYVCAAVGPRSATRSAASDTAKDAASVSMCAASPSMASEPATMAKHASTIMKQNVKAMPAASFSLSVSGRPTMRVTIVMLLSFARRIRPVYEARGYYLCAGARVCA
mmetsp:Transcript_29333/g.90695  ORF Transcript_29333/g.90695 Transcript_29333/m.90695 type:complete len:213 (+) Transcript_29333:335-973(+)